MLAPERGLGFECGLPLHAAPRSAHILSMPKPKPKYEQIKFLVPGGTRALYKSAAELTGANDWKAWAREALHAAAAKAHEEHDVAFKDPGIHPVPPPPLQDRSKLR